LNDVAVVGAGPAGIAASVYLKRAGINITLFEKNEIGGLLLNANLVENYPGFPNGINGRKLCKLMKEHLEKWDIKPIMKEVKQIKIENDHFILNTQNDKIVYRAVIVATGTKSCELGTPGERDMVGKLVFYEIKDLLPKVKPENIITVIGGGDAAFDYSLNLVDKGVNVELFFRSEKPKCLALLEERVKKSSTINLHSSLVPIEIINEEGTLETKFRSSKNNHEIKAKSDYVLIACGRNPNKKLLSNDLEKSNVPGLYIAGDVRTEKFRQVGIAVGEGIYAAMSAETYLRGRL